MIEGESITVDIKVYDGDNEFDGIGNGGRITSINFSAIAVPPVLLLPMSEYTYTQYVPLVVN